MQYLLYITEDDIVPSIDFYVILCYNKHMNFDPKERRTHEFNSVAMVDYARSVQELHEVLLKRKVEAVQRNAHYLYAQDPSAVAWPNQLTVTMGLLGIAPVAVSIDISSGLSGSKIEIEASLSDDSELSIAGNYTPGQQKEFSYVFNGKRCPLDGGECGITLATLALSGELRDELALADYYKTTLQPIDPLDGNLLKFIQAGLTETCVYETSVSYDLEHNDPTEEHDFNVTLNVGRNKDGEKTYVTSFSSNEHDGHMAHSISLLVGYTVDSDMLIKGFTAQADRSSYDMSARRNDNLPLDLDSSLDYAQVLVDAVVRHLQSPPGN